MRLEKMFGVIGLGLFFLFPLVGLLQMSDADAAWRAAAARTAQSVWRVESPAGCGVVVSDDPLRLAVAGRVEEARTPSATGVTHWRAVHADPSGRFTILAPVPGVPGIAATAIDFAAIGDLDAGLDSGIEAVLVGPPGSDGGLSLWLGELTADHHADGRPAFRAAALRPLRAETISNAAEAAPTFDPALRGAPFVTRDGVVLALCSGAGAGVVRAVPMATVREAVALLDRRAAQ